MTAGTSRCEVARCCAICRRTPRSGIAALGAGGRRRPAGEGRVAPDVLLGDAAARPGPGQEGELDAELGGDSPHERRRLDALGRRRSGLLGVGRRRLSGRGGLGHRDLAVADDDERSADRDELAFGHEDARDGAGGRRGDLDRRLVGVDLDERVVLLDVLADLDEPAGDLALGDPLAEVRKLELVGHG